MADPERPDRGQTGSRAMMGILRIWLWGSGIALASLVTWMVAPVLFLLLGLTALIGLICAVPIKLARIIEARRRAGEPDQP